MEIGKNMISIRKNGKRDSYYAGEQSLTKEVPLETVDLGATMPGIGSRGHCLRPLGFGT
jgi:hypothetical protein